MSDTPLIKRFLQHQGQFMAYLMAITRDLNAAEEIFQNAAVVIMEKSVQDDTPIENFRAWSKEIVRRQALSYMQKQIRGDKKVKPLEPVLLDQITETYLGDRTSESDAAAEASALRTCISQLAVDERLLLQKRYEGRMPFSSIAAAVGKTEGAVQRSVSRIRKKLHDCVVSRLRIGEVSS